MKKIILISILIISTTLCIAFIANAASSSESEAPLTGTIFQRMNDTLKRMGAPKKTPNIKQESIVKQTEESVKGYTERLTEGLGAEPDTAK